MGKVSQYQEILSSLDEWDAYLLAESGLPGPRGNIELAQAVAQAGTPQLFERYLTYNIDVAPVNSSYEFLAFCGALGLGRLLSEGDRHQLKRLRELASDPRWRMREAVAMALQQFGEVDMEALIEAMREWSHGSPLEQRAAAAALCEPRLLTNASAARQVLDILDGIMIRVQQAEDRRTEGFLALRKGLGYCWSVAVAALPAEGRLRMEKWLLIPDSDVRWIMQENLTKNRLIRTDPAWVSQWKVKKDS